MSEIISLYLDDAIKYGEESAIVLHQLRRAMLFPEPDSLEFNGIVHVRLSNKFFGVFLSYKPLKRTKTVLRKLHKMNVISIQDENYYAVLE